MKGYLPVEYVQLVMHNLLYNTGLGRPYIKFELSPICDLQLRHGKKRVFLSHFIFHQFRTNQLEMPHWIWRKISQVM